MKLLIIAIPIIGLATFLIIRDAKEKKQREEMNAEVQISKTRDHYQDIKDRDAWLDETLKFENQLNDVFYRLGYSEKRIKDSIIAIEDQRYFDTLRPYYNKQKLRWYKEYRQEYLVKGGK